jgi:WD40 repeat protein
MSGRFVRKSSFRHVHGVAAKPQDSFLQADVLTSGDGNYIAGNDKFLCYAKRGGGGPVIVLNIDEPKRLNNSLPKLEVHRGKVLDFAWNPFNSNLLATASEDCHIKVSQIPEGGLTSNLNDSLLDLAGHEKKVTGIEWHPTCDGVLASAGFDHTVKVWDIGAQSILYDFKKGVHGDALQHLSWNRDGSQLATTCKDKTLRLFDPRDEKVSAEVKAFQGSKKSSVVYLSKQGLIATVGFTRSSMRQIKVYDPRNLSTDCITVDIDQSAGVMIPHYDHDTSILYVGGKGDSSIKYWECVNSSPYLHFLAQYSDTKSQKGFCFLPKTNCDVNKCEIANSLRITRDAIIPVNFVVPRKATDIFQSDLYPDAYAGIAAGDVKDYTGGANPAPELTSMRPGERRGQVAKEIEIKATYAELEAQLAAANARIAELEAQLGQ